MTWARIDDQFADHPKVIGLSDRAFRIHIRGICYAARQLTDGFIPLSAAQEWGMRAVLELEKSTLWKPVAAGYQIHDFLDYNPSREQVLAERATMRTQRQIAGRARAASADRSSSGTFTSGRTSEQSSGETSGPLAKDWPTTSGETSGPLVSRWEAVTSGLPAPTRPLPQPLPQDQNQDQELKAGVASAPRPESNGKSPNDIQTYLLRKLHDRGEPWSQITFGALTKLNGQYTRPVVTTALQRMAEETRTNIRSSPYGLLEEVCREVSS
jgi:hypothetical protein